MGRPLTRFIEEPMVYACAKCGTHLATDNDVKSKKFSTQNGSGFLMDRIINITNGPSEEKELMTGRHVCENVFCVTCGSLVGWKYIKAYEENTQYKVGKFVLDRITVVPYHWKGDDLND